MKRLIDLEGLKMIVVPGIYTLSAEEYHADPTPAPSLSAHIAHTLITCSPLHAWTEHPRLNPAFKREEKEIFDLGTAAHAHLLEGESGFEIIDAKDWRTNAAKEARDEARKAGKIPLLAERWADVQAMATAAKHQLSAFQEIPPPFADGKAEQTLIWREGDVWCRARLDWLHDDHQAIDDYKTTGAAANPDAWTRGPLFNEGYDLQAAFYLRGLKVLEGIDATFRFIVQENFLPFALSVIGLGPDVLMLAEKKRFYAVNLWRECLTTNRWPGYPTRTCFAELPPWQEAQWLEKEMRGGMMPVIDDGRPIVEQLAGEGE